MTEISAEKVKKLREKSGAGMMDCKRALSAVGGDLEKAIDHLRKEGVVKAAKKAGRATSEGLIGIAQAKDGRAAALVEINCETDFVARTDQFLNFLSAVAEHILKNKPKDLDSLLQQKLGNVTVQEALAQMVSKVGENMGVRRFHVLECREGEPDEKIATYVHAGAKIGTAVKVKGANVDDSLVRDIAMHVAAMNPQYVDRNQIPANALEREKDVLKASPDLAGKPENILDKILQGKLNRFFSDVCLVEQPFIKDATGKKAVGDFLKEKSPGAQVVDKVRFQVGEETH